MVWSDSDDEKPPPDKVSNFRGDNDTKDGSGTFVIILNCGDFGNSMKYFHGRHQC